MDSRPIASSPPLIALTNSTATPLTARHTAFERLSSVRTNGAVLHESRRDAHHFELSSRQPPSSPVQVRAPLQALNPIVVDIDVGKRLAMLPKGSQRTVAQAVAQLISDSRQLSGPDLLRRLRQEQQNIDMGWKNRGHVDWVLKSEADQRSIVHANLWGLVGACILRRDQPVFQQHLNSIESTVLTTLKPRLGQKKLADLEAPARPPRPFDPLQSGLRLNGVWTTKEDLVRKVNQQTPSDDPGAQSLRPVESNLSKCTLGSFKRPDELLPFVQTYDDQPNARQAWLTKALGSGSLVHEGDGLAYGGRPLFLLKPLVTSEAPAQPEAAQLFYRSSGANSSMPGMLLPATGLGRKICKPEVAEMTGNLFLNGYPDTADYVEELTKSFSQDLLSAHCRDLMAFAKSAGVSDWSGLDNKLDLSRQDIKAVYDRLLENKHQLGKHQLTTQDGFLTRFGQDSYLALAVAEQQHRDPTLSIADALGIKPGDPSASHHLCQHLNDSPAFQNLLEEARASLKADWAAPIAQANKSSVNDVNRPSHSIKPQPLSLEVIPEASEQEECEEELVPTDPSQAVMNSPHVVNMMTRVPAYRDQLDKTLKPTVLAYVQSMLRELTAETPHALLIEQLQADSSTGNRAATWVHGVMRSGNGFCGIGGEAADKFEAKVKALLNVCSE